MEIHVTRSLNKAELIISGQPGAASGDDSLQMVLLNKIPYLISLQYDEIDSRIRLVYDITSRISLADCLEGGRLQRQDLTGLVRGIGACSKNLQEYLLDPRQLMLRSDCIFTDAGKQSFAFCFNPFYEGSQKEDLQGLFERIIACIDYEDQELVRMTYELFMAVQGDTLSWDEIEKILPGEKETQKAVIGDFYSGSEPDREDLESYIHADKQDLRPERFRTLRRADIQNHTCCREEEGEYALEPDVPEDEESEGFLRKLKRYLKSHRFREILTDIDDGLILQKIYEESPDNKKEWNGKNEINGREHVLKGIGRYAEQCIVLARFPFYIGKLQGKSDYILNIDTVSRNHLCICRDTRQEECFLVMDQKSRNGTWLNGKRIRPYEKERIYPGDHIRLAEAEFVFH